MRYHRILVKLSGGAIAGDRPSGFHPAALNHIADEVLSVHGLGIQVGVVVGGGNIFKGELGEEWGIERAEADNIGMIATVINSLMLRGVLNARGDVDVRADLRRLHHELQVGQLFQQAFRDARALADEHQRLGLAHPRGDGVLAAQRLAHDVDLMPGKLCETRQRAAGLLVVLEDGDSHIMIPSP